MIRPRLVVFVVAAATLAGLSVSGGRAMAAAPSGSSTVTAKKIGHYDFIQSEEDPSPDASNNQGTLLLGAGGALVNGAVVFPTNAPVQAGTSVSYATFTSLNDSNTAVGIYEAPDAAVHGPIIWSVGASNAWQALDLNALGTAGSYGGRATVIDDAGQIAGILAGPDGATFQGFYFAGASSTATLVPSPTPGGQASIQSMNAGWEIVSVFTASSSSYAYYLLNRTSGDYQVIAHGSYADTVSLDGTVLSGGVETHVDASTVAMPGAGQIADNDAAITATGASGDVNYYAPAGAKTDLNTATGLDLADPTLTHDGHVIAIVYVAGAPSGQTAVDVYEIGLGNPPPVVNSTGDLPATGKGAQGCDTGKTLTINGAAQTECTLRAAIQAENAASVTDKSITFAIPAVTNSIYTIQPATALPALTADEVTIDGTTQLRGFVQINGSNLGSTTPDLEISGAKDTVQGFTADNSTTAVLLDSVTGSDVVRGNVFGLTDSSTTPGASGVQTGVDIENSPNNLIGGTADGDRNVLSGLSLGVEVHGTKATGNRIQGNYFGTDASGTQAIGDYEGVGIIDASHTLVGGPSSTAGQGAGNVLLGTSTTSITGAVSGASAVTVGGFAVNATSNTIQGNTVGLLADGTAAPTDGGSFTVGVSVVGRAAGTIIGGSATGAGNVISDPAGRQISLNGTFVIGSQVLGNLIGTDRTGQTAISGSSYGVAVTGARTSTVGTAGAGANVITAQNTGIYTAISPVPTTSPRFNNTVFPGTSKTTTGVLSSVISGDIIGPLADGNTAPSSVQTNGVILAGNGDTLGPNNEISFNGGGVGVTTPGETVIGNQIGTDSTGLRALPNGVGVAVGAKDVAGFTLGVAGARPNTVSGNLNNVVLGSPTVVHNNYIGTTTQGNAPIAPYTGTVPTVITDGQVVNAPVGVLDLAGGSIIGGTRAGFGNVISGNTRDGIDASDPVMVEGNKIGVGADGVTAVPNTGFGISAAAASQLGGDPTQGGPTVGPWTQTGPAGGNVIANNGGGAILLGKDAGASIVVSDSIYANTGGGITRQGTAMPGPSFVSAPTQDGDGNTVALITVPNTTDTVVQIYTADSCTTTGATTGAQGKTLLQTDTTNSAGVVLAVIPLQPVGTQLTTTLTSNAATAGKAATSDFSPCAAVTPQSTTITKPTINQNQPETGDGTGFTPGETVDATGHSTPVNLGAHKADSAGDVTVTFTVPAALGAGQHELVLTGRRSGHTAVVGFTVDRTSSTLSVAATPRSITYGMKAHLSTQLHAGAGAGPRTVQLQRRIGKGAWTRIASTTTSSSGRASATIRPSATAAYRWTHVADGGTNASTSKATSITVHARVTATLSKTRVRHGTRVQLRGIVGPAVAHQKVDLQRRNGHNWRTLAVARLTSRSAYTFTITASKGTGTYRVTRAATRTIAAGISTEVTLHGT